MEYVCVSGFVIAYDIITFRPPVAPKRTGHPDTWDEGDDGELVWELSTMYPDKGDPSRVIECVEFPNWQEVDDAIWDCEMEKYRDDYMEC